MISAPDHLRHLAETDGETLDAEYPDQPVPPGVLGDLWRRAARDAALTPVERLLLRPVYERHVTRALRRAAAARAGTIPAAQDDVR